MPKAASMFGKVNVPILGIVENMSHFVCPSATAHLPHLWEGGGEREAKRLGVPLLGHIPLEIGARR